MANSSSFPCLLFADQSPPELLTQFKAGDSSNNEVISELLVIPDSSTVMDRTWTAVDETIQALDIEARVICSRAADVLEEQPGLVMGEPEEEIETSIRPCNLLLFLPTLFVLFISFQDV